MGRLEKDPCKDMLSLYVIPEFAKKLVLKSLLILINISAFNFKQSTFVDIKYKKLII